LGFWTGSWTGLPVSVQCLPVVLSWVSGLPDNWIAGVMETCLSPGISGISY